MTMVDVPSVTSPPGDAGFSTGRSSRTGEVHDPLASDCPASITDMVIATTKHAAVRETNARVIWLSTHDVVVLRLNAGTLRSHTTPRRTVNGLRRPANISRFA